MIDWDTVTLGEEPDTTVAKRLGVSQSTVCRVRNKRSIARFTLSAEGRFWTTVTKGPGCWIRPAAPSRGRGKRYSRFSDSVGTTILAHRFSWKLHFGEIPEGMGVLHECDNTECVRPDHLFLGTQKDNARDMVLKTRFHTRLTKEDVHEMRRLRGDMGRTYRSIADQFDVVISVAWNCINRKTWWHV